jgi:hypothetical protein
VGADIGGVAGQFVHRGIADTYAAHPAAGPGGVEIHDLIGNLEVHGHPQMHGRHLDAVFYFETIDDQGAKRGSIMLPPDGVLVKWLPHGAFGAQDVLAYA